MTAPAGEVVTGGRLRGLRGRMLLLVVVVYALVGAGALLGFYQVAESIIRSLGAGYATQYANQQRSRIQAKVDRELVLTQKLAGSPLLRRWAANEKDADLRRQSLEELEHFRQLFADHSWFFVVRSSGDYYTNDAKNAYGGREFRFVMDPKDPTMQWYFATLEHVDDFDLHVDYDAQLDVTKLFINAIVKDADGNKIGVGGTGLDLSGFIRDIVRTRDLGVQNLLVDENGFVQGHSSEALMRAIAHTVEDRKRLDVYKLMSVEAEKSELRTILDRMKGGAVADAQTRLTIDGQTRIAAITYMPELHWAAIVLVDPAEVIHLRMFQPIVLLLGAALLLTILLVSWLLDRLVLTRLGRLTRLTHDIAAGQYDRTLDVDRDDEIGQLTHSFNTMSRTVGDYMRNLEQRVVERTEALNRVKEELEESGRKVMDSIRYARLIQSSLLAKPNDFRALLPGHSVLWKPRDIVGGDFYTLYSEDDGGFVLAIGDCTGHGVPGAFMTMAAKAVLDRAVAVCGLANPAEMLSELHRDMRALLQTRYAKDGDNGLDVALVYVHPDRRHMTFAGAKLPLWVVRQDGSVVVLKGDRHSVGYGRGSAELTFTNRQLPIKPGERYVLLTDGILDQNGGEKSFALGQVRLKAALAGCRGMPAARIAPAVEATLKRYQGSLPQRDDIAMVVFSFD